MSAEENITRRQVELSRTGKLRAALELMQCLKNNLATAYERIAMDDAMGVILREIQELETQ